MISSIVTINKFVRYVVLIIICFSYRDINVIKLFHETYKIVNALNKIILNLANHLKSL